ncbi:MAG: hypothetical protein QOI24_1635 [Acidobacteriota bacterium]|nr:hypothetical protein [Acidobacteriota bacterium]
MATATTRWCVHHPQRAAFALCMTCTRTICQECATQWDGIYHCAPCLAKQRTGVVARSPVGGWLALIVFTAILLFVTARLMVWSGALIAGLF